ncbi:hypothetical protein BT67DRAFT_450695 [Trichocladium antarcticum]|uniref:Myb-like DNA-binding domain-containing protein n=1 Tax=Trichocladium antarcticum TaxID=1450529 RepID=A0AAN6ZCA4_9PEZI|nr:hypothetical protein BT67DRAFT_450695 [Trichocladium antarcticum]
MPPKTAPSKTAPAKTAKPLGADPGDGRKQPTAQEAYMFYTVIRNMKGKPDIDWNAVAADNNFKNAETAKVRYGQIKRKLGLDNWSTPVKGKGTDSPGGPANEKNSSAMPETPSTARTKKTATAPGTPTPATGAGVKKRGGTGKRATNPTAAGRGGRKAKAKTQALIKQEEDNDDDMIIVDNPAQDNPLGAPIKSEYNDGPTAALPLAVLQRRATLDHKNGAWVQSPVSVSQHSDWVARLPANIQASFYSQLIAHNAAANNSYGTNNNDEEEDDDDDVDVATQNQLLREHYDAQFAHHGLYPAAADMAFQGNGNGGDDEVDLHAVPMHPAYFERMEPAVADEAADEALFGRNGMVNWP